MVGAGPAGSATALRLAERGLSVALIERGPTPGAKNLSGGVLYGHSLAANVPAFLTDAPYERVVTRHVTTLVEPHSAVSLDYTDQYLALPDAHHITAGNAVTVLRARFDPWLADQAVAAGAMLMPGMRVDALVREPVPDAAARPPRRRATLVPRLPRALRPGRGAVTIGPEPGTSRSPRAGRERVCGVVVDGSVLRSRVTVLADGASSFLARSIGLRRDPLPSETGLGVKVILAMDAATIEQRFGVGPGQGAAHALVGDVTANVAGGGFLYTNTDSLSVGYVVRLDALVASGRSARELMSHLLSHPRLDHLLSGGKVVEYGSHLVVEGGLGAMDPVVGDGVVVVGDAAGLTINSGLTLRGMDLAISAGLVAGDAVADAVEARETDAVGLARYAEALEASPTMSDMRRYARTPSFLASPGPYGPWGEAATSLMRAQLLVDGTPHEPLHTALREAASGRRLREWLGEAARGWRAL